MKRLIRTLAYFSKKDESFVDEYELNGISLLKLKKIFDEAGDSEMLYCYQVTRDKIAFFEEFLNVKLDLSKYDYFLECCEGDVIAK